MKSYFLMFILFSVTLCANGDGKKRNHFCSCWKIKIHDDVFDPRLEKSDSASMTTCRSNSSKTATIKDSHFKIMIPTDQGLDPIDLSSDDRFQVWENCKERWSHFSNAVYNSHDESSVRVLNQWSSAMLTALQYSKDRKISLEASLIYSNIYKQQMHRLRDR